MRRGPARGRRLRPPHDRGPATSSATTPPPPSRRPPAHPRLRPAASPAASAARSPARPAASRTAPASVLSTRATSVRQRPARHRGRRHLRRAAPCGPATTRSGSPATDHVTEWWKNATPRGRHHHHGEARPDRHRHLRGARARSVTAVERPEIKGDAWVGKTSARRRARGTRSRHEVHLRVAGRHHGRRPRAVRSRSRSDARATKLTRRVTNDAGFARARRSPRPPPRSATSRRSRPRSRAGRGDHAQGQAAQGQEGQGHDHVVEIVGVKKNGTTSYKKIGKAKIKNGKGAVRSTSCSKGKHKLVFSVKGKGKVGSGDITKKVKLKR